jgi:cellulose synthase/poly-beta-1,6-N-acetylglucosamine synthase-like glycosyltransferase
MGASSIEISIIVPARDASRTIGSCVEALLGQSGCTMAFEVLVVDDGSQDDTAALARQAGAEVVGLSPSGPAAARNRGVEVARGDLLVFTDADCVPDAAWLSRMVAPFDDPDVSATKGTYRTDQRALTARFVQREYESRYRRMSRQNSIDFVDTYAAAFRRAQFFRAGGYDESFPNASVEDQEFSFRYSRIGGRIVFVDDAVVRHLHADTLWKYFRKKVKIAFWKMRVLRRHPDKIISDSHTPVNVKVEMGAAMAMLLALPLVGTFVGQLAFVAMLGIILLSSAPLVLAMARVDGTLGAVAPFYCFVRASALGIGCIAGVVTSKRHHGDSSKPVSWLRDEPASLRQEEQMVVEKAGSYEAH